MSDHFRFSHFINMWLGKSNQNPGGNMKKFVYLPERAVREPYPPGFVFSSRKSKLMSWRPEKLEQLKRNSVFGGMINKQERKNMLTKALPPLLWMNSKRSRQEKQLRLFSMCDKTRHIFFNEQEFCNSHKLPFKIWGHYLGFL